MTRYCGPDGSVVDVEDSPGQKVGIQTVWFACFCRYHHLDFKHIKINWLDGVSNLLTDEDKNMSREEAECRAEAYLLEEM